MLNQTLLFSCFNGNVIFLVLTTTILASTTFEDTTLSSQIVTEDKVVTSSVNIVILTAAISGSVCLLTIVLGIILCKRRTRR